MDLRLRAPSTARNRDPILSVLRRVLPAGGRVLEIACGSGEHAVHFARDNPLLDWRPSDPDAAARASAAAWIASEGLTNVREPLDIDVRKDVWGVEDEAPFDAIVSINMVHIAPWSCALGLMSGAGRLVREGGVLFLYGPFMRNGAHTAPSNEAFDASLKARNSEWGIRDMADIEAAAQMQGFMLREVVEMPANNFSLVFARA
jgi:cyclopropane fatty-acyl-phospholipid synthase-like methyltransferase